MSAVRVLLVDDQPLIRTGLGMILGPNDGFEIVAEADDGEQAIAREKEKITSRAVFMETVLATRKKIGS